MIGVGSDVHGLQEINLRMEIGGDTGKDIMKKEVQGRFDEQLILLREIRQWDMTLEILSECRIECQQSLLDKVAGLGVRSPGGPYPNMRPSAVGNGCMGRSQRVELFFYYPQCGNGKKVGDHRRGK